MKTGEVVHIRVTPQDIMTSIDIVQGSDISTNGMSLAMIINCAFKALCEHARVLKLNGACPRDIQDYVNMVEGFKSPKAAQIQVQIKSTGE